MEYISVRRERKEEDVFAVRKTFRHHRGRSGRCSREKESISEERKKKVDLKAEIREKDETRD